MGGTIPAPRGERRVRSWRARFTIVGLAAVVGAHPIAAGALTLEESVARSGNGSNALIGQMLESSDLTDAMAICRGLGKRRDPSVGSLILELYSRTAEADGYRSGLLLRLLLQSVFFEKFPDNPDRSRVLANEGALTHLAESLQNLADDETRRLVILVLPDLSTMIARKTLAGEGAFLASRLEKERGLFSPERMNEALAFLRSSAAVGGSVGRDEIVRLIELSRDRVFVVQARAALSVLE